MQVLGTQFSKEWHHDTSISFSALVGHFHLAAGILGCLEVVPLPTHSMPCLPEAFSAELPVPMDAPASPKDLPSMSGGRPGFSDVLDLTVLCPWPEQC